MNTYQRATFLLIALLPLFSICNGQSQNVRPDPPIPIDAFSSDKAMNLQVILSKHFSPGSKFGFLNVNYITGDYQNNKLHDEYESLSFLKADIYKGFAALAGVMMNHYYGFRPTAGLQYVFATPKILFVILPRIDLNETHNIETIGIIEYKPRFNKNWGLYTRLQGLYNYNVQFEAHDRSFIYSRVGVSYKQYAFGLGLNNDWYGPIKINENHFGGFLRVEIF